MASPILQESPVIFRNGTSGNNLDIAQPNTIAPTADIPDNGSQAPLYVDPPSVDFSEISSDDYSESSGSHDYRTARHTIRIRSQSRGRSHHPRYVSSGSVFTRRYLTTKRPSWTQKGGLRTHDTVEEGSDTDPESVPGQGYRRSRGAAHTRKGARGRSQSSKTEKSDTSHNMLIGCEERRDEATSNASVIREKLEQLRCENERIRRRLFYEERVSSTQPAISTATYKTFYYIEPTHYLDEPHWEPGDGHATVLRSLNPIRNFHDYLDQHPDIAFAIVKRYDACPPKDRSKIEGKDGAYRVPEPTSQILSFISIPMIDAVEQFISLVPKFRELFHQFSPQRPVQAPYLFMFYSAPYLPEILPQLGPVSRSLLMQLEKCISQSHGVEQDSARSLAKEGRVSNDLFGYLVQPGDVLVKRAGPRTEAYIALDWAMESEDSKQRRKGDSEFDGTCAGNEVPTKDLDARKEESTQTWYGWTIPVWSWIFDGKFQMRRRDLDIGVTASFSGEVIPINRLEFIPLKYTTSDVRDRLEKRGRMFWTLRHRRLVDYQHNEDGRLSNVADRCMVDVETYKKLHPKSDLSNMKLRSSLSREEMTSSEPPLGDSLLLFPPRIPGFNLLRKMWVDLFVDHMSDVTWNKQAFADLVIDEETKELIQALVTTQLASQQSTDFVAGKGNGLIMLLHGGPGTGKTFTAEGVAEFAEKPLLRVTCGDVGTAAEIVKKKLQSSFYLGKIWDCVVLLDEADVFLEEIKDLNRHALVSVFLRELEYHEGILIMTSNRVGTFDEAFKSRIQLSLHYENLGLSQRRKIWRNFINRVKTLDATIDHEDIIDHLDDLSKVDMNGREIRNAITTARQLAQYRDRPLSYSQLGHVLRVIDRKLGK